jgi:hypothetical protein
MDWFLNDTQNFPDQGQFEGTIVRYDNELHCYHVKYDDGDSEDIEDDEIEHLIVPKHKKKNEEKKRNHSARKTGDGSYIRKYRNGSEVLQVCCTILPRH